MMKKHVIKVDEETIQKRLEKPWKQLEKCAVKSRQVLIDKGVIQDDDSSRDIDLMETLKLLDAKEAKKGKSTSKQADKPKKEKVIKNQNVQSAKGKVSGCTYYQDPAIVAASAEHTKPVKNSRSNTDLQNMDKTIHKTNNQNKSQKNMDNQSMATTHTTLEKKQKNLINETQARPPPGLPPTGWLKQSPNKTSTVPPGFTPEHKGVNGAPAFTPPPVQQGEPTTSEQNSAPKCTSNNPPTQINRGTSQTWYSTPISNTPKNCDSNNADHQFPDTMRCSENNVCDANQGPYFPSAYEGDILHNLRCFLANSNAYGDSEPKPDLAPSGIEKTYEYDDYRQDTTSTLEEAEKVKKLISEYEKDPSKGDLSKVLPVVPNLDVAAALYESGEDDYAIYYQDSPHRHNNEKCAAPEQNQQEPLNESPEPVSVNPVASLEHDENLAAIGGDIDGNNLDEEYVEDLDEDDHPDEFQWNWVPRSKRWRDQLKRLVNSKPGKTSCALLH